MPDLKTLQAEIEKLQNRILELEKVKADLTAQNGTPFKFGVNSSSEYGYMLNGVLVPFGKKETVNVESFHLAYSQNSNPTSVGSSVTSSLSLNLADFSGRLLFVNVYTRSDASNKATYNGESIINKSFTRQVAYNGRTYNVKVTGNANGGFISGAPPVGTVVGTSTSSEGSSSKSAQTTITAMAGWIYS